MFSRNAPKRGERLPFVFAFFNSLAWRLTLWYTCTTFALVLLATGFLYEALSRACDNETDSFLKENLLLISAVLRTARASGTPASVLLENHLAAGKAGGIFVRIFDRNGVVVSETPGMSERLASEVFPGTTAFKAPELDGQMVVSCNGAHYRGMTVCTRLGPDPDDVRVLQVASDRRRENGILESYRSRAWMVLVITLCGCVTAGYVMARRGLEPLRQITAAARRVRSTTLHEHIEPRGLPSELHALVAEFNEMLDRLDESFRRLSQFSADIAHELRTPLSNLRGEVEVALGKARSAAEYREIMGSTLEECERLSRMVSQLLFLARAERTGTELQRQEIDVAHELESVREFYEAAASEGGVALTISASEGLRVHVDRDLFQCAVGNLVANAIAYTPPQGEVFVSAAVAESVLKVGVRDTGCGIPAWHLPNLFDRFYRVDSARTNNRRGGFGLGLAIVRSIALLHGGSVEIESAVGKGTCVTLRLPMRPKVPGPALPV